MNMHPDGMKRNYGKPSTIGTAANDVNGEAASSELNWLAAHIYLNNVKVGWYSDPKTGRPISRNIPEMLCLIHSEVSEGMEGYRKSLQDDHLPHRTMLEVELADAMIRILDLAGYLDLDIGGALVEKLAFNKQRQDHKLETRREGGKQF